MVCVEGAAKRFAGATEWFADTAGRFRRRCIVVCGYYRTVKECYRVKKYTVSALFPCADAV